MQALAWTAALLLSAAAAPGPSVRVKLANGHLSIDAANASLAEILQKVSDRTGMRVIWDGPPPTQPVKKITVADRSPADAVLNLIDGHGYNYAVVLSPSGQQI